MNNEKENHIAFFLKKFTLFLPLEVKIKRALQNVLSIDYSIHISTKEIQVKQGSVYFGVHPHIKQSILRNKKEILEKVSSQGVFIRDLR